MTKKLKNKNEKSQQYWKQRGSHGVSLSVCL